MFVFFFQAEDGIRDLTVTGVQTCALPICQRTRAPGRGRTDAPGDSARSAPRRSPPPTPGTADRGAAPAPAARAAPPRSEERRVGKECRSRWPREREKKKEKRAVIVGVRSA